MTRGFRVSRNFLFGICVLASAVLLGCETRAPVSSELITRGFSALSDEQLDVTILDLEERDGSSYPINIHGLWVDPAQALEIAREIRRNRSSGSPEIIETTAVDVPTEGIEPTETMEDEVAAEGNDKVATRTQDLPDLENAASPSATPSSDVCPYHTAAELVASCPSADEIQKIRNDFNLVFEDEIIANDLQVPWNCLDTGDESSTMLAVYNTFRLMMCVPFDRPFPWAPEYDNLYEWLLGLDIVEIKYFKAFEGQNSHAWDGHIAIVGNSLADPIYRDVINPQSGVGVINLTALLVHEARHAGDNITHDCGYKDTNLDYMGAWAVHYYLWKMLAENTGAYFTAYELGQFAGSAEMLLETRFCELE